MGGSGTLLAQIDVIRMLEAMSVELLKDFDPDTKSSEAALDQADDLVRSVMIGRAAGNILTRFLS